MFGIWCHVFEIRVSAQIHLAHRSSPEQYNVGIGPLEQDNLLGYNIIPEHITRCWDWELER